MNGEKDFNMDFLEKVYVSIQKTQLGFHSNKKELEILAAYKENPKKAQEMHLRELEKETKKSLAELKSDPKSILYNDPKLSLDLIIQECGASAINVYIHRLRQSENPEEIRKYCKEIESILRFSTSFGISTLTEHAMKSMWEEITRTATAKKYNLMEGFLEWVGKFSEHIYSQWNVIVLMFSKFNRSKLVKKDGPSNSAGDKGSASKEKRIPQALTIINEKCYLYQQFIEWIFLKSSAKFTDRNLLCLVSGLIQVSKGEIS